MRLLYLAIFFLSFLFAQSQNSSVRIALLKYNGGGDWYANPTSLPNLIKFCNKNIGTDINPEPATVEISSPDIFNYPFAHMTGHGNVVFTPQEVQNLRNYLISGGFLHIDDNYGMNEFVRREMKKVFPESDFVELPFSQDIYHQKFEFAKGLPKIHEHDGAPAQGFGIFYEGRLVCFYSFECDLGDGWEDSDVHKDSDEKRTLALKMGANLISYVFQH
jgi:hypothetical protein